MRCMRLCIRLQSIFMLKNKVWCILLDIQPHLHNIAELQLQVPPGHYDKPPVQVEIIKRQQTTVFTPKTM